MCEVSSHLALVFSADVQVWVVELEPDMTFERNAPAYNYLVTYHIVNRHVYLYTLSLNILV